MTDINDLDYSGARAVHAAMEEVRSLTGEQREAFIVELRSEYCLYCSRPNPTDGHCHCMNDE
jgi:hypothetical protein